MSSIKIGINGLGRIGRTILRECYGTAQGRGIELVAANSLGKLEQVAHLITYDSVHGKFPLGVSVEDGNLKVDGRTIAYHQHRDPAEIPWDDDKVDIVIDATGFFKDQAGLGKHKRGPVKKVIMCAPGKDLDGTFVMGINHNSYDPSKHHIVSNASCTTNCLSPMAKVIDDHFGITSGFMTTVHSYTGDQRLLDAEHPDPRRARSAALSMVPTTTGAAKAVGLVIPKLKGKLNGLAVRVPTPNVSLTDLTCFVERSTTALEVNEALEEASRTDLKGILRYEEKKLVSADFMGMAESSCIDASLTDVIDGKTVKAVAWYDNEIGFSNRVLDLAAHMGTYF